MDHGEILELLPIITHPIRFVIIKKLLSENRPMYVSELAKELDIPRKNISFHLSRLKEYDFVSDELRIKDVKENPVAVRYYAATDKLREALEEVRTIL